MVGLENYWAQSRLNTVQMRNIITASSAALFFADLALIDKLAFIEQKALVGVLALLTLALILEAQTK